MNPGGAPGRVRYPFRIAGIDDGTRRGWAVERWGESSPSGVLGCYSPRRLWRPKPTRRRSVGHLFGDKNAVFARLDGGRIGGGDPTVEPPGHEEEYDRDRHHRGREHPKVRVR